MNGSSMSPNHHFHYLNVKFKFNTRPFQFSRADYYMLRSKDFISISVLSMFISFMMNEYLRTSFRSSGSWFLSRIHPDNFLFLRDCDQIPNDTPQLHSNFYTWRMSLASIALMPRKLLLPLAFFFAPSRSIIVKDNYLNLISDYTVRVCIRVLSFLNVHFFK
jgi:hypothetical protein